MSGRNPYSLMKSLAVLVKWRIVLLSGLVAAAGALLAVPDAGWRMLFAPILGTCLLAGGAAALNQIQERDLDVRMARTRHRPLPSGMLRVCEAVMVVAVLLVAGLGTLAMTERWLPVLLGVLALVAYNGIYTPLKRITPWAPVLGAVVGVFAPAIGWTGAGGTGFSLALSGLMMFFVLWQVPHFWLLFLNANQEYRTAGLPVLTTRLGDGQLKRVTFIWIVAAATLVLLLPLLGAIRHTGLCLALVGMAIGLVWQARAIVSTVTVHASSRTLVVLNGFALATTMAIIVDRTWMR